MNNQGEQAGQLGELVKTAHEQCPGKSQCDCQHFVGQAIQQEWRVLAHLLIGGKK